MAINFSALRQFPTGLYPFLKLCSELQDELFPEDHHTLKASPHCCLSLVCSTTCSERSTMEQNHAKDRKNLSERWDWTVTASSGWCDQAREAGQPLFTAGTDTVMGGTISWTQWTQLIFQLPFKKAFKKSACYAQQNRNWYVTTVRDCK